MNEILMAYHSLLALLFHAAMASSHDGCAMPRCVQQWQITNHIGNFSFLATPTFIDLHSEHFLSSVMLFPMKPLDRLHFYKRQAIN